MKLLRSTRLGEITRRSHACITDVVTCPGTGTARSRSEEHGIAASIRITSKMRPRAEADDIIAEQRRFRI
jgi:hypothetical protein